MEENVEINVTNDGKPAAPSTEKSKKRSLKRIRRKLQAKEKKAKASKDPSVPKYVDTPERQSRTAFIGNIPVETSKKQLVRHFENCGRIESVRFRGYIPVKGTLSKKVAAITKDVHPNCKTIVGYIVFKKPENVAKALELNTSNLNGNYLTVQRVGETIFDPNKSVFVGNLPFDAKEDDLRQLFSDSGKVTGVRIVRDSVTGKSKKFGFVAFSSTDAIALVTERTDYELPGRTLRVYRSGQGVTKMSKNTLNMQRRLKKKSVKVEPTSSNGPSISSGEKLLKEKKKKVSKKKKELKIKKEVGEILSKKSSKEKPVKSARAKSSTVKFTVDVGKKEK